LATTDLTDFNATPATTSGQIPIWDSGAAEYVPGDPLVQGLYAHGSASQPNPVVIGGYDGSNVLRALIDSSGRFTVNINGTVGVTGTFWQATQPVSGAISFTAPQHAILDSGTAVVTQPTGTNLHAVLDTTSTTAVTQATGTNLHAVIDTTSTTAVTQATGTNLHSVVDSGTITTVSTVTNLSQMAGVAISLNTGVRDTGTQRVTIATNDVVPITDNSGSLTVDQPTGTNLHVVTDATSVTAAILGAETTKVIGTVRAQGNVGGIFDTTQNAAVAANSLLQGCNFTTSPAILTTANQGAVQCNSKGELLSQLTDGTTNVAVISGTTALKTDMSSVAGTATVTSASGVQKVGIVGNANAAFDAATGAAPPANAILAGGITSGATGGFMAGIPICDSQAVVNISTITTTLVITGVSARHVRICSFQLVTAAANNVAWLSGTGATCGTGTAGMSGGTTAASGYNLAANGGIATGSGLGTVLKTVAAGDSVCLITSATTQLSGTASYTIY
jgi:hypothetical protein